jgi:hypothetical protein
VQLKLSSDLGLPMYTLLGTYVGLLISGTGKHALEKNYEEADTANKYYYFSLESQLSNYHILIVIS